MILALALSANAAIFTTDTRFHDYPARVIRHR